MKKIGNCVYLHYTALKSYPEAQELVYEAFKLVPNTFVHEILKINLKAKEVSFIACEGWNTLHEPIVGDSYKVNVENQTVKYTKARTKNKQIYHHKWMFVDADYDGFDIEESKARSKAWEHLDLDKKKIGNLDYWEEKVIKILDK